MTLSWHLASSASRARTLSDSIAQKLACAKENHSSCCLHDGTGGTVQASFQYSSPALPKHQAKSYFRLHLTSKYGNGIREFEKYSDVRRFAPSVEPNADTLWMATLCPYVADTHVLWQIGMLFLRSYLRAFRLHGNILGFLMSDRPYSCITECARRI